MKKLTIPEQREAAQKIIETLDGVNFRDAQQVLLLALNQLLELSAVVQSSQVAQESDEKR